MSDTKLNITRRDFLKYAGLAGTGVIIAKLAANGWISPLDAINASASDPASEAQSKHRWAMVIDQGKCIGCNYCTYACKAANDIPGDVQWNTLSVEGQTSKGPTYLARPCMHCENAPCVEACPVKATFHRADGLVAMDYNKCIGCRYCEVACPYDARKFNWEERTDENPYIPTWGIAEVERRPRGVVEKCTFCIHRIDAGLKQGLTPGEDPEATPACVNICPVNARTFGDLKDPNSQVSKLIANNPTVVLREELGTKPSVLYIPPAEGL